MILCATMLVFAVSACSSSEEEPEEETTVENVTIEDEGSDTDSDSDKGSDTGTDTDSGDKGDNGDQGDNGGDSSEKTVEGVITMCDGAQMYVKTDDGEEYKFLIATAEVTGDGGEEEGTEVTVTYSGEKDSDGLYNASKVEQH